MANNGTPVRGDAPSGGSNSFRSKAAGAKKPTESQKAKALWALKAAKERWDEFYDSARKAKHFGKETDKTGIVGRRPNHGVGRCSEVRGESVSRLIVGSRLL